MKVTTHVGFAAGICALSAAPFGYDPFIMILWIGLGIFTGTIGDVLDFNLFSRKGIGHRNAMTHSCCSPFLLVAIIFLFIPNRHWLCAGFVMMAGFLSHLGLDRDTVRGISIVPGLKSHGNYGYADRTRNKHFLDISAYFLILSIALNILFWQLRIANLLIIPEVFWT